MWKHLSLYAVSFGFGVAIDILHLARAETAASMPSEPSVSFRLAQVSSPPALANERDAIQDVVSAYYDAVSRSAAEAAAFYGEPTLLVLPTHVTVLGKRTDVEEFLAKIFSGLKPLGYSHSKVLDPRIK